MVIDVSYCMKEKSSLSDKEGALTLFQHELLMIRTNHEFRE